MARPRALAQPPYTGGVVDPTLPERSREVIAELGLQELEEEISYLVRAYRDFVAVRDGKYVRSGERAADVEQQYQTPTPIQVNQHLKDTGEAIQHLLDLMENMPERINAREWEISYSNVGSWGLGGAALSDRLADDLLRYKVFCESLICESPSDGRGEWNKYPEWQLLERVFDLLSRRDRHAKNKTERARRALRILKGVTISPLTNNATTALKQIKKIHVTR